MIGHCGGHELVPWVFRSWGSILIFMIVMRQRWPKLTMVTVLVWFAIFLGVMLW